MKKWFLPILLGLVSLLVPQLVNAQSTTVSATIQDANGQALVGGTYNFSSTAVGQVPIKGTLDNSGAFAGVSIPHTPATALINDYWTVTICPDATFPCATAFIQILGSTASLTSVLSPISAISFNIPAAPSPVTYLRGYTDAEIITTPKGGSYFNVILSQVRTCIALSVSGGTPSTVGPCTAWTSGGGGSGGVGPGTANFLSCFVTTTTVGNCPSGATDTGGVFTIPETTQLGGGATASSVIFPSGPTSGCQTPVAGVNIFCSDGTNNTFDISANGGAYVPLATVSTSSSGAPGQLSAFIAPFMTQGINLFIAVDAIQGAGIGAAPTSWVSGTTYPLCQSVSNSGNYLAVSTANGATTPGTNSHIWYAVPNGSRPTQFDCAFYIAQSQVTSVQGIDLELGMNTYNSSIGMTYPVVGSPGLPGVNIHGRGVGTSIIKQTTTLISGSGGDGLAMLNVPPATTNFNLPRLQFSDFTLDANNLAPAIFDLHACQQCTVERMQLQNGPDGIDHYFEAGTVGGGSRGWVYELTMTDVTTTYNPGVIGIGHGNGAFAASVTVSGGVPTITVSNGGANYGAQTTFRLVKTGGLEACTSIGTFTPTFSGGAITAVATTSSGCLATGSTFLQIYPNTNVNYSFTFSNMSDSHFISDLVPGGVGSICGVNVSNVTSFNSFYKLHPIGVFNGVCNQGTNNFYNTQLDTSYNWGIDEEGQGDVVNYTGSMFEWAASNLAGSSDYHFGKTTGQPINSSASVNIFSDACGNIPAQSGYAHLVGPLVAIDSSSAGLPPYLTIYQTQYCNLKATNTINYTVSAPQIVWGNGTNSNYWLWSYSAGFSAALTLSNVGGTNTNPWTWFLTNSNAATSGANQKSPLFGAEGNYWDGTVTQPYGWSLQTTFASGTGPLATFAFKKNGVEPAGGHIWTFDGTVGLPTGSTAVTQTVGDNTTAIATDAFVIANAGGGGSSAFSALTSSTNTTAAMVVGTGASLSSVPQFNIGAVGTAGVLGLLGSTSGTATITAPAVAGTAGNAIAISNAITVGGSMTATGGVIAGVNQQFQISTRSLLGSTGDGIWNMTNNAGTGFTKLTLGPGTSAFPALCPSGTTVLFGLASGTCTSLTTVAAGAFQGPSTSAEVVASSATPTFALTTSISRNVLTANVTSFTLGTGADGQTKTLCFKQGAGPFTVAAPANVHGFFVVGVTNADWSCQSFVYDTTDSIWLATTPGVINQ